MIVVFNFDVGRKFIYVIILVILLFILECFGVEIVCLLFEE